MQLFHWNHHCNIHEFESSLGEIWPDSAVSLWYEWPKRYESIPVRCSIFLLWTRIMISFVNAISPFVDAPPKYLVVIQLSNLIWFVVKVIWFSQFFVSEFMKQKRISRIWTKAVREFYLITMWMSSVYST